MDSTIGLIGAVLTLVGVLVSAWLTRRSSDRKIKVDGAQLMIDQLQEEVAVLRRELAAVQRVQRVQGDYIGELRRHIADGHPPPPPAWPTGLIT